MLSGKYALITGAAKRIGRACAISLADQGVNIFVHYNRSGADAKKSVSLIKERGVGAWAVKADLSKPEDSEKLIDKVLKLSGKLDILVNSASIYAENTLKEAKYPDFIENININAISPFILARKFASICEKGSVINFLDARITDYDHSHAAYHLSKRMLFSLTRMMSIELAPEISVNGIAPGIILPPDNQDKSSFERISGSNPLNKTGTIKDITDTLIFLLESRFITGEIIFVDGGRHLRGSVYGI